MYKLQNYSISCAEMYYFMSLLLLSIVSFRILSLNKEKEVPSFVQWRLMLVKAKLLHVHTHHKHMHIRAQTQTYTQNKKNVCVIHVVTQCYAECPFLCACHCVYQL